MQLSFGKIPKWAEVYEFSSAIHKVTRNKKKTNH